MTITDKELLNEFRGAGPCGYCGRQCRVREAHHVHTKGTGRLDIRINLIALGGPWECRCHRRFHDGSITREEMIEKVAEREGMTAEEIKNEIWRLRRMPKSQRTTKAKCPKCGHKW